MLLINFICMPASLKSVLSQLFWLLTEVMFHVLQEVSGPSDAEIDKKSYLAMMDFSEEEIDLAVSRLGM